MTAAQIIDKAQETYPDLTDALGLVFLQSIHDDLCMDFPILKDSVTFSSIVSGTGTYSLSAQVVGVRSVTWYRSSDDDDFIVLEPMDVDQLDAESMGWREEDDADPRMFYIDGGEIGFVPAPDESTTSGYPKAVAQVLKTSTLATDTEMPTTVFNHQIYVEGIRVKWSEMRDKENLQTWRFLFDEHVKRLERYFKKRNRRFRQQMYPETYAADCI